MSALYNKESCHCTPTPSPLPSEIYDFVIVGGGHAGGTCKMGLANDPTAVVNQKGLVYHTTNLRICDMSIIPVAIRWPNSTLYVVAEKIAHDILTVYA
jgi:choline dehydrogenase-like flavoprotein